MIATIFFETTHFYIFAIFFWGANSLSEIFLFGAEYTMTQNSC